MSWSIFGQSPDNDVHNDMIVNPDGSINTLVQDQYTPSLDLEFLQDTADPTTVAVATAIDDYVIAVTDATDIEVGNTITITNLENPVPEYRFYLATVLAKTGNDITVDSPLDYAFDAGSAVFISTTEMAVDGTLANPQAFRIYGAEAESGVVMEITRINISIVSSAEPDDGKFGGIDALTNGIVLRRKNGDLRNMWNAKDNATLGILAGIDIVYTSRTVPQGSYGTKCRISYAGPAKRGVALRLEPGDYLEILIRDALSDLTSFKVAAQGHVDEGS